jgi:hypothetical protein
MSRAKSTTALGFAGAEEDWPALLNPPAANVRANAATPTASNPNRSFTLRGFAKKPIGFVCVIARRRN